MAQGPSVLLPTRRMPASRTATRAVGEAREASGAREAQPDRRWNILLAAEKLFARSGFLAVSFRDIAAEAGVPLALVGYYYGAKHELYHAIFESWSGLSASRLESLKAAASEPALEARLVRIIEAFVGPVLAMHQHPEGQHWAMMAARDLAAPTPEADRAQREFFDPMAHAFIDALMGAAPGATRGQVAWCYQFMLGALLHHLTDVRVERLSRGENRPADPAVAPLLVTFVAAGFRAVLAAAPRAARPKTRPKRSAPEPRGLTRRKQ